MERTQVAIIGGGPAGLPLSHMLHLQNIDSVVIERQTKDHVLQRIRAGVLEHGTVQLLRDLGLRQRMDLEGHPHDGTYIAWEDRPLFLIDTKKYTGKQMLVYGQTAITQDLYSARERDGGRIIDCAADVQLHAIDTDRPSVTFQRDGETYRIGCDFIAGCDGFHGISRRSIPSSILTVFECTYPFGWLGTCPKRRPSRTSCMRSTEEVSRWRPSAPPC